MVKSIVMTKPSATPKVTDFERVERNQLFAEFEQQALRITQDCSEQVYGDLPSTQSDYFANYLDGRLNLVWRSGKEAAKAREKFEQYALKQRPKPVGGLSIGAYHFNQAIGHAIFYETRGKGTGYYYRLRTVRESHDYQQPAVIISDFAVKPTAPNRSINWLIATRNAIDDSLLERDDRMRPQPTAERWLRTWKGTDLSPGSFHPTNNEDYQRVKLRLLEALTILGKMSANSTINDMSCIPDQIRGHLSSPVTYSSTGPEF